jgi:L-alanine-DL-glutamate epimerase-like enolase superfamily enzyme
MALLDALTQREGVPLWQFFGGAGTELETDMTVTTGSAEEAAAAARDIRARGIRMIKVKVGGAKGAPHDLARIAAIHEAAPEAPLVLDGNAGVSREAARELVAGLKRLRIAPALLEQWLAKSDLDGLRALREESGWLVAADEAVTTRADAERVAAAGAADVINIKLMKAGIAAALEIVAVAQSAGLGLMIGGNVESILAMTASACFAAGQGGFRFADLDTPLFLAENPFAGGFTLDGGRISVAAIRAGHGVTPKAVDARSG